MPEETILVVDDELANLQKLHRTFMHRYPVLSANSGSDALDLDAYVTKGALDGLFKYIAIEEKSIRTNPLARSTDLLKKVFGG